MIRLAKIEDFDAILDMSAEFWCHTQFSEPFDREHTLNMVKMSYDHGLLVVVDDNGVCGFLAAIKSPLLGSSRAWMATELAWYVKPENRGKLVGVELVKLFERLCVSQEVKYVNMAFMETSMPERVRRLYEIMGYKLQETVYTKVLTNGGNHGDSNNGSGNSLLCK